MKTSDDEAWNNYHIDNDPTQPLKNKLGLTDQEQLSKAERDISYIAGLFIDKIDKTFDKNYFLTIHKTLFKDIYPWAGKIRNVNMAKDDTVFEYYENIDKKLEQTFSELENNNYFKELPQGETIKNLGLLLCELNQIHSFREGNGRTQRIFVGELALSNGYYINWNNITPEQMVLASTMSYERNNPDPLVWLLEKNTNDFDSYKSLLGFNELGKKEFFDDLYKRKNEEQYLYVKKFLSKEDQLKLSYLENSVLQNTKNLTNEDKTKVMDNFYQNIQKYIKEGKLELPQEREQQTTQTQDIEKNIDLSGIS